MSKRTTMKRIFTSLLSLLPLLAVGQNYIMDGTPITDCSGIFYDSGGPSNNYGDNENITTTICPDGSTGTHIKLNFSGIVLAAGDLLCFYDGPDTGAPLLSCSTDYEPGVPIGIQATAANTTGCLTVVFTSDGGGNDVGWSAGIQCIPACQLITSEITYADPVISPPVDTGYIDVCPGTRVTLSGRGVYPQNGVIYEHSDATCQFEWDFGDGTRAIGPNTSHVYMEPGGYKVQLRITDQYGCINTNYINQRVRVSSIPTFNLGDNIPEQICPDDTLHLTAIVDSIDTEHSVSVESTIGTFQAGGVRSDSLALPDGDGTSYETSIDLNQFSPGQILTDIDDLLGICVNMEHSWLRDLEISITCPDGTSVVMHNHAGHVGGEVYLGIPIDGDGINPTPGEGFDYCWTPNSTNGTWIEYSNTHHPQTLPSGDYSSYQSLDALEGCPLNGQWTIKVTDLWAIDNGYIFSWGIHFAEHLFPNLETFKPDIINHQWVNNPSIFYYSADSIVSAPQYAGIASFNYTTENSFGCKSDTTVSIEVLPPNDPDCFECADNFFPLQDTTICEGDSVVLTTSPPINPLENITFSAFPYYAFGYANHPPANPYEDEIAVSSISPAVITDANTDIISVCMDIQSDFDADLQISLISPNGVGIPLAINRGGGGQNFTQTCFTPTAATPISAGVAPFTGDYLPDGNWSDLNGEPINGDWKLSLSDAFALNSYDTISFWSITFRNDYLVNYNWTPATSLSCVDCPNPAATPEETTTYYMEAVDNYNCVHNDTVQVNITPSLSDVEIQCDGSQNNEIVFSWNQIPGVHYEVNINNTGWVTPNASDTSHIVGGLGALEDVDIEVNAVPDVPGQYCYPGITSTTCTYLCSLTALEQDGPNPVSCYGDCDGSITVIGDYGIGTYNYFLDNDPTAHATGDFSNLCPGPHFVVVNDDANCPDTLHFIVPEPDSVQIIPSIPTPIACNGGSTGTALAFSTGGTGDYSYHWDDPMAQTQQEATGLSAGEYHVTVTDANNCTATAGITLTEPEPITTVTSGTNVECWGYATGDATVTATGGTPEYTYLWDDAANSTTQTIINLPAGTYHVTVTDEALCEQTAEITITQPAMGIASTVTQDYIGCYGASQGTATATPSGGSGDYTFLWENGQTTATATNLSAGWQTVVIADNSECSVLDSVNIIELDSIDLEIVPTLPTCHGKEDGELTIQNVTGGSGTGYSFQWSTLPIQITATATNLAGGLTYTVTITDDRGCHQEKKMLLPEKEEIILTKDSTTVNCFGESNGSAAITGVDFATGSVQYLWDANAGGATTSSVDNLPAGTYSVTVTDANDCQVSTAITVNQPELLRSDMTETDVKCHGGSDGQAAVSMTGGIPPYNYHWSNAGNTAAIELLPTGIYHVTVTDTHSCMHEDSVFVAEPDAIDLELEGIDITCHGGHDGRINTTVEGGTPPYYYSLDGETYTGTTSLIALEAGSYRVYVKDLNDCIVSDTITIVDPDIFVFDLPESFDIEYGDTVQINAGNYHNSNGAVSFDWVEPFEGTLSCNDCPAPYAYPLTTATYYVTATDENGCAVEDPVTVLVTNKKLIMVPTGFSPDGNNQNERLVVHGKPGTTISKFRIFDRWGNLVFENNNFAVNDFDAGWDGTFKGKEMNPGVFIWSLEVEFNDGKIGFYKGETTLIR